MLDRIFAVMALCPQHTFLVLTKRAERMRDYCSHPEVGARVWWQAYKIGGLCKPWPLPNIWAGVSVEDQRRADERIPLLLDTPAAVRWISAEPLLGPVDMVRFLPHDECDDAHPHDDRYCWALGGDVNGTRIDGGSPLDWVVCGGESGPGARPMDLAWARSLIAQCKAAGVPVFMKQLGSATGFNLHDRKGGDPMEWATDLRVREYPEERP
jgi:protein gp37